MSGSGGAPRDASGSAGAHVDGSGTAGAVSGSGGNGASDGGTIDVRADAGALANDIYVSPTGSDDNPGTAAGPVQTLQQAQKLVRRANADMASDITVTLADGYYRMTSPLTLDASDSGSNGHDVVWTAAAGAHPVVVGSTQIKGWSQVAGSSNVWVAQGPAGIKTRQLYVDGARAVRATGPVPTAATLAGWKDPSGGSPPEVEFVYVGGWGPWTEGRCPVASVTGGTINMAQPCWDNSTKRGNNNVGPGSVGAPTRAENAYQLLDAPGEWYLDVTSSKFYYIPLAGQTLASLDVEAPVLEALVTGGGTATSPLHDVVFHGLQFSYATWMGASSPNGFSEVQANYLVWGTAGPTAGNAEYSWFQIPGNVSLTWAQRIQFTGNAFVHLGGAGLALGNGAQKCLVQGNVITDTSGSAIELGNDDMRNATGADQTLGNTISDNHVFDTPVEFRAGIGIDVGYAASSSIVHNQIDHTPYTGISIGWGGWPDKQGQPALTNYSHNNDVSNNLLFEIMQVLSDGGGIYTNGQTTQSHSYATGETVKGNVLHDLNHSFWALYSDNGSDWMTVTGNAVWSGGSPWGYCHDDHYSGEGGGLDNQIIQGNYWQGSPTLAGPGAGTAPDAHCLISGNTMIKGLADVPASLVSAAGLEAAYQGLLQWTQVPPPRVQ
ncbi:MAG TPA: right-handed parallel beta-helix repeat-containing protein [Polyangia bacterium]|nr:right-handed parallel beta-helix repeat-containing protein [Polyangia bacterium]